MHCELSRLWMLLYNQCSRSVGFGHIIFHSCLLPSCCRRLRTTRTTTTNSEAAITTQSSPATIPPVTAVDEDEDEGEEVPAIRWQHNKPAALTPFENRIILVPLLHGQY